jgi:hypothetical protein
VFGKREFFMKKIMVSAIQLFLSLTVLLSVWLLTGCDDPVSSPKKLPALEGTVIITGIAHVGETLTVYTSALEAEGKFAYQWIRGDSPIEGAIASFYTLVQADEGTTISVEISCSGYSGTVTSFPTGIVVSAYAVSGAIRDYTNNAAIAGVLVQLKSAGAIISQVTSGIDGAYTINNITNGAYTLYASKSGYNSETTASFNVNGANVTGKDIMLAANGNFIAVTDITGVPTSTPPVGTPLALSGTVLPSNATNKSITSWTVKTAGGTGASITGNTLTATTAGTVTVTATIANGAGVSSDYIKDFNITITTTLPVLTGTVNISGKTVVGQTLIADTTQLGGSGAISYQWVRGITDISGAVGKTYMITDADYDYRIKVRVNTNDCSGYIESPTTERVTLPNYTGTVTITGNAWAGQILTANTSGLGGSGTISYQWIRCGSPDISIGANSATYTLVEADIGSTIKFQASRSGTSGITEESNPTAIILPQLTGSVTITGNTWVGQTLTANIGSLGGSGDISYQWVRGTTNISGAINSTYTLVEADMGNTIKVRVSRSERGGTVESTATAAVLPVLTGSVTINGNTWAGQILIANTGDLVGSGILSYQWVRGLTDISGATNSTYTLAETDVGNNIKARVSRVGYGGTVESAATAILPILTGSVTITGNTRVGQTLTADTGSLEGSGAISYQWIRGTAEISDATSNVYTLVEADAGSIIGVRMSRSGYGGIVESPYVLIDTIFGLYSNVGEYLNRINSVETPFSISNALLWLSANAQSGVSYTIIIETDETLSPKTLGSTELNGKTGVSIALKGLGTERIVQIASSGSLFEVKSGVTVTINENITLKGITNNSTSLVTISGGIFKVNSGATISGNTSSSYGAGVYVSSGTLIIDGGKISGNISSSSSGGGVYVASGTFTMSGGEISGNTSSSSSSSSSYGGGIYVGSGTFTMSGGKISDNTTSTSYNYSSSTSNTSSPYGGGVYVGNGAFMMNGGEISGNTSSSSSSSIALSTFSSYGGGVSVGSGTFTMNGGEIFGNTSSSSSYSYGGGVYVESSGIFKKINGIIYGYTDEVTNSNKVVINDSVRTGNGHAVYINSTHRRDKDVTAVQKLYANGSIYTNPPDVPDANGWIE